MGGRAVTSMQTDGAEMLSAAGAPVRSREDADALRVHQFLVNALRALPGGAGPSGVTQTAAPPRPATMAPMPPDVALFVRTAQARRQAPPKGGLNQALARALLRSPVQP